MSRAELAEDRVIDLAARRRGPAVALREPSAPTGAISELDRVGAEVRRMLRRAGVADLMALSPDERTDAVTDALRSCMATQDFYLSRGDFETVLIHVQTGGASGGDIVRRARPDFDALQGQPTRTANADRSRIEAAKTAVQERVVERMDVAAAVLMPRADFERQLARLVAEVAADLKLQLNVGESAALVALLVDDMLGLGPLEPLLADDSISDIMVNGPFAVFVERGGKLEATQTVFRDSAHVLSVAQRMVTRVGRRIDETSPLCDARLADGSRVNVIIPPLAVDGTSISIRKFSKKSLSLETMGASGSMSPAMARLLAVAAACRLNIVVSGGTGSGKTTMLNALSRLIDSGERTVTIEDAAELQLQQPHVVRLEARPPNLEGQGGIAIRELMRNALRMRPDRIILGEIRGSEVLDMLQAMNTGHDGSMSTLHANSPRECLTRIENMMSMAGQTMPQKAMRTQIAGAVQLIVQIARMRDGVRRVTHITELLGMEGDIVTTQDLFVWNYEGEGDDGKLIGAFEAAGVLPHFAPRAAQYGLAIALREAV